ncbi:MAG: LOG family protein [Chthoniobacterales bacterium]
MHNGNILYHRKNLYTVEELFEGYNPEIQESYKTTLDWRISLENQSDHEEEAIKAESLKPKDLVRSSKKQKLKKYFHDYFLDVEIKKYLESLQALPHEGCHGLIGIMGGHAVPRSSELYFEVAKTARQLTREKYLVVTGGGPGVMEAANLGAWLAPLDDSALPEAIKDITLPRANNNQEQFLLQEAWNLRLQTLSSYEKHQRRSLAIPTWHYPHELTNVFATSIAKFFNNAHRETVLLSICEQGIIFFEGSVATVQEVFDAAAQNHHYTTRKKRPLILFNKEYWNPKPNIHGDYPEKTKPVWPLLLKIAQDTHFENQVTLLSSCEEAIDTVKKIASYR